MLSRKDKEFIQETIRDEIVKALTIRVVFEQAQDPETLQPLAVPKKEVRDIYLPEHWAEFLPRQVGAFRGLQEQVILEESAKRTQIEAITNILLQFEDSLTRVAKFSDQLKQIEVKNLKQLEE